LKHFSAALGAVGLLVGRRLEIIQQVELKVINQARWYFVDYAVAVRVSRRVGRRRGFNRVKRAIEHHPRGGGHPLPRAGPGQVWVYGLKAHLVLQRADDELSDGYGAAVMKERTNAEIRVDPQHARGIERAIGVGSDRTVANAFAGERPGYRPPT